jgi:hypothetical protein
MVQEQVQNSRRGGSECGRDAQGRCPFSQSKAETGYQRRDIVARDNTEFLRGKAGIGVAFMAGKRGKERSPHCLFMNRLLWICALNCNQVPQLGDVPDHAHQVILLHVQITFEVRFERLLANVARTEGILHLGQGRISSTLHGLFL